MTDFKSDFKDKELHPIVEEVVSLLKKRITSEGTELFLDKEAIEQLKESVSKYFGSKELIDVFWGLSTAGCYFDEVLGYKDLSKAIVEILNTTTEALDDLARVFDKDIPHTNVPETGGTGEDVKSKIWNEEPDKLLKTLDYVSKFLEGRSLKNKSEGRISEEFRQIYLDPDQILLATKQTLDKYGAEFFETNSSANLLYQIGRLAGKRWKFREIAEPFFRMALKYDPYNSEIWKDLGDFLLNRTSNRDYEAELAYKTALKYNPDDSEAWANLGYLLEKRNCLKDAEEAYRTTLSLNPGDIHTRYYLIEILKTKECHQEAYELLQDLLISNLPGFQTIEVKSINYKIKINNSDLSGIKGRYNVDIIPEFNGLKPQDIWGDVAEFIFDPVAFHKSIDNTGWFEIFTCTCGEAGCDFWTYGIFVSEKDENIIWFNVERFEKRPTKLIFPKKLIKRSDRELIQLIKNLAAKRNDLYYFPYYHIDELIERFLNKTGI
ncbi:MAG: tetratricopeptide repeat protein [Promethearchaeota archaeon]